jgi:hypothetical protein
MIIDQYRDSSYGAFLSLVMVIKQHPVLADAIIAVL